MNKKRTLYWIEKSEATQNEYAITKDVQLEDTKTILEQISSEDNASNTAFRILTDASEYQGKDQIIPLQPEQIFFMDYLDAADIENKTFLEIGLGSGVLSIFSLLRGAKYGTGLDINPRAKIFTGFNAMINGVEDQLEIRDGNTENVYASVAGETYDFVFSNPPFEPTPVGMDYYFNSAAGIYGLSFVEALMKGVDSILADDGVFEMVTMAPGTEEEAFMIYDLVQKYLPNRNVEITLDLQPITYNDFVDRFVDIFNQDEAPINQMKEIAASEGVTHCHMLIFKYRKGEAGELVVKRTSKTYETWESPLGKPVNITAVMQTV
jgi:release factor glutamine methyltransferase